MKKIIILIFLILLMFSCEKDNSINDEKNCEFKSLEGKAYCKRHINYQINNENTDKCSGISYSRKNIVTLYGEKIKLLKHLNYHSHGEVKNNKNIEVSEHMIFNIANNFFLLLQQILMV